MSGRNDRPGTVADAYEATLDLRTEEERDDPQPPLDDDRWVDE